MVIEIAFASHAAYNVFHWIQTGSFNRRDPTHLHDWSRRDPTHLHDWSYVYMFDVESVCVLFFSCSFQSRSICYYLLLWFSIHVCILTFLGDNLAVVLVSHM